MSVKESRVGICEECSVKNGDISEKLVYRCELCNKWFCEQHRAPKFPYFVDWDTISDVQGDPIIKASFYTDYRREGGHPDFIFFRRTIEASELEEKIRTQLIKQAIDRMEEANRERKTRRLEEEAKEKKAKEAKERATGQTETTGNKYGNRFVVPLEVYSNATYREYLDCAQTEKSVKVIVDEYYKKYGRREKSEETTKKKHWWQ